MEVARDGQPPRYFRGITACWHPEFRLRASRTVVSHPIMALCYSILESNTDSHSHLTLHTKGKGKSTWIKDLHVQREGITSTKEKHKKIFKFLGCQKPF
jgi:hypothetical protein